MTAVVGVDVGGTFTDLVGWVDGRVTVAKTPTRPRPAQGVVEALDVALGDRPVDLLVHGTTVATNALLERDGGEVMLVTDPGFEDLIEIGRQNRPSLYDPEMDRPSPLVSRRFRTSTLDPSLVGEADTAVVASIGGYADPATELEWRRRIGLLRPDLPVTVAGEAFAEFREFERINTAVVNAFLTPKVASYLQDLESELVPLRARRMMVMRSSGGLLTATDAGRLAAAILLSGPAGGVMAAAALGRMLGMERMITFDMGGTSTDVARIERGVPEMTAERLIDGQVVRMPSVAIHTVGAGGGSLGWLDPGGALRVGPRSAGAFPGPAAYLRGGTEPTVTDADVVLGRLPSTPGLPLDQAAARSSLARLGGSLGREPWGVAEGMVEVVEATMERAVRFVSIEQGSDPRGAALLAFGGAGGLHATSVARRLGMSRVVVPPLSGVFSALGLLVTGPRHDAVRTVMLDSTDADALDLHLRGLIEETERGFRQSLGHPSDRCESWVDVRYRGQAHELTVPHAPGNGWTALTDRFHLAHRQRNGFSFPDDPVEAVTIRVACHGRAVSDLASILVHSPQGERRPVEREARVEGRWITVPVWDRRCLTAGDEMAGPAIVVDPHATTWIGRGETGVLHPIGALEIVW